MMSIGLPIPKDPTHQYPRGDVDNYAKAALDAMQAAGIIEDDNDVVMLYVLKHYTEDVDGLVVIELFQLEKETV